VNSEIDTDDPSASSPLPDQGESGAPESPTLIVHDVQLDVFEGPLDLLLYLIRKNEVDIYDIPIATITAQYLSFLRQGKLRDLEQAADFVLLAATLMKVKSQMLLPRDVAAGEEEGGEDPREELIRRLLEYQQFKEVADWLSEQGLEYRDVYPRSGSVADDEAGALRPVSLFDLLKVYKHVIDHVPAGLVHHIVEEIVSVEECINRVLGELARRSRLRFFDLIEGGGKHVLVATFISVLELLKSQRIKVQQARPFDDIWIEKTVEAADEATTDDDSIAPNANGGYETNGS
jgi:segregation and condensation protein A